MEIRYSKQAVKFINNLDKTTKTRIKHGIEGLTKNPPEGDIKLMQGFSKSIYRLRIGKYRIVYSYSEEREIEILNILKIGSRGDIYK